MYDGALIFDKPEGFTSHDAVAKLRGIFRQRRVGHGGTLDPMATGVLPVFFGPATRAVEYAAGAEKEYVASFRLGTTTDTQDRTGTVLSTAQVRAGIADVEAALSAFVGEIEQVPPMYSAVWKDGRRLYDLARQGIEVERDARKVFIHSLTLLDCNPAAGEYALRVVCSKGTYVRTLCHDIGQTLGCGAVMTALRRTRVGAFALDRAVGFEPLSRAAEEGKLASFLIPTDRLFSHLPAVTLEEKWAIRAKNGGPVPFAREGEADGLFRVYDEAGALIMLARPGQGERRGLLVPDKMFWVGQPELAKKQLAPNGKEG